MGSSSSGSKSGLSLGGSVRNRLHAIWKTGWDVVIFYSSFMYVYG